MLKLITKIKYNYLIIKERYKKDSPLFFKKLKKLSIKITVGCVGIITVNNTMSLGLNPLIISILGYIIATCVGMYGTSILTKEDKTNETI